jgi:hypothetical protein
MTMTLKTTTLKTLASLALAAAALTVGSLATTGMASAHSVGSMHNGFGPPPWYKGTAWGHGPAVPPGVLKGSPPRISCGLPCEGRPPVTGPYHGPDRGYGQHDPWHWHFGYRNWRFPVGYVGAYAPGCVFEYKWRTAYVPGYGLQRTVVKVCEAI